MIKQLQVKPDKLKKYLKHNAKKERSCGLENLTCEICGRHRGLIQKYNLNLCRQCFRDNAKDLGFKKYH